MRLLIAFLALCLIAADLRAGPILRRIRERNSGVSSCGSTATASACGSAATASACTSDTLPVPPLAMSSGVTWTDSQGNLWTLVRPAPKGTFK